MLERPFRRRSKRHRPNHPRRRSSVFRHRRHARKLLQPAGRRLRRRHHPRRVRSVRVVEVRPPVHAASQPPLACATVSRSNKPTRNCRSCGPQFFATRNRPESHRKTSPRTSRAGFALWTALAAGRSSRRDFSEPVHILMTARDHALGFGVLQRGDVCFSRAPPFGPGEIAVRLARRRKSQPYHAPASDRELIARRRFRRRGLALAQWSGPPCSALCGIAR